MTIPISPTKPLSSVSGHCPHCSYGDRFVLHGVPWCPLMTAVAWIDTNASSKSRTEEDVYTHWTIEQHISRPVAVGELVLLVDSGDGPDAPFATWGRVLEVTARKVTFRGVAEQGNDNGWLYVDPS